MVVHGYNPTTQEAEPQLHSKILSQNQTNYKKVDSKNLLPKKVGVRGKRGICRQRWEGHGLRPIRAKKS
jgi:hypothetical protein